MGGQASVVVPVGITHLLEVVLVAVTGAIAPCDLAQRRNRGRLRTLPHGELVADTPLVDQRRSGAGVWTLVALYVSHNHGLVLPFAKLELAWIPVTVVTGNQSSSNSILNMLI